MEKPLIQNTLLTKFLIRMNLLYILSCETSITVKIEVLSEK